ncbi:hypothetical protein [Candidatus Fervidibacter sacchari]
MLRLRWRQRPKWRLVRWQSGWALLIALPSLAHQIRCSHTVKGVRVDGEFCVLTTRQSETCWRPEKQLVGRWWVSLPLPSNWRPSGSPQTVRLQGRNFLLLPVQPLRNLFRQ